MRFTNPYSTHLGTFTWAELQASYPNAGGALAALPAGATVLVVESTWQGWFTPDIANAYWTVVAPTNPILSTALLSGTTSGADQIVFSQLLPAGLLRSCRAFGFKFTYSKSGTTDAQSAGGVRLGTANSTADTSLGSTSSFMSAAQRSLPTELMYFVTSATQLTRGGPQNMLGWNGTASVVTPTTYTVPDLDSNALYLTVGMQLGGTTNTPQIQYTQLELLP